jgi:hypothetical protein
MQFLHKYTRHDIMFSIFWAIALSIISLVRFRWRPQPCTTVESISGFYGPGAYWAWILTTISAIASTLSAGGEKELSIDFVSSSLYTLVAMGDLQLRACVKCDPQFDFQVKASLQVISMSSILCFLALLVGEIWRKGDNTGPSSGRWQLWKALLFFPFLQAALWVSWIIKHSISVLLGIFMVVCFAGGGMWLVLQENVAWRIIRHSYLCLIAHMLAAFQWSDQTSLLTRPTLIPLSGAKLSDMDQVLTLVAAILVMIVQWKVGSRALSWFYRLKNGDKWKDEQGKRDHPTLPRTVMQHYLQ